MATESWFYLKDTPAFSVQKPYIAEVERILQEDTSLPNRLVKNYELLVKLYNPQSPLLTSRESGYKIHAVDDISELFDKPEPQLIRKELYSGRRQGDKDYGDVSPG
jgi:hypothetical protein